jgi:hypothetical protein
MVEDASDQRAGPQYWPSHSLPSHFRRVAGFGNQPCSALPSSGRAKFMALRRASSLNSTAIDCAISGSFLKWNHATLCPVASWTTKLAACSTTATAVGSGSFPRVFPGSRRAYHTCGFVAGPHPVNLFRRYRRRHGAEFMNSPKASPSLRPRATALVCAWTMDGGSIMATPTGWLDSAQTNKK